MLELVGIWLPFWVNSSFTAPADSTESPCISSTGAGKSYVVQRIISTETNKEWLKAAKRALAVPFFCPGIAPNQEKVPVHTVGTP